MADADVTAAKADWDVLVSFLPDGWREKAKELGALRRCRKFADADALLRTLLIHLAEGCSLRETAAVAKTGELTSVSDVALLKRLHASGEWFRWLCGELMRNWVRQQPETVFDRQLEIRVVDASMIKEPAPTGSAWGLHYAISLPDLRCEQAYVTDAHTGESFEHFEVAEGEVFMGDRAYGNARNISHVLASGGHVLVRVDHSNLPMEHVDGDAFDLFAHLHSLSGTQLGDWPVRIRHQDQQFSGRLCALKKSAISAERARQKARHESQRKGHHVMPETLDAAGYIMVFTSLPSRQQSPRKVLELYRGRWQIELVFKRLKSIVGLGHLPKISQEGIRAWIHGKLFVAFLVEAMIVAGESFFPWGYPLRSRAEPESVPVARG